MILAALLTGAVSFAQPGLGDDISWKTKVNDKGEGLFQVEFTGRIAPGGHTYSLTDKSAATRFTDVEITGGELVGAPYEIGEPKTDSEGSKFYDKIILAQDVKVTEQSAVLKGTIFSNVCVGNECHSKYNDFDVRINATAASKEAAVVASKDKKGGKFADQIIVSESDAPAEEEKESKALWSLILEAILWGFAMLLTPCVFPMVPMTVSFFMKGSENPAAGRFKAAMYGLFIILLYTVPISVIIMLTRWIGGDAVTADIFNWLSTHWIPNIIFFVVFMIFAASFFGAFEITMPQSLVNKSDKGADKKGLAGVFFMALTLVLVSFSCTGPIVGTVLIESTQGEFWAPMVTMLAFSGAFALPFTILAFFPSLLKKFKKSGGSWLNSVKVVLGFIEIALGLKFLSVADQT